MMVMPVIYKNILLYFLCDGYDGHFKKGRGAQISVSRAVG